MSLAVGSTLGPYEILAEAGVGGMGVVYRARDTRLDRTVAIKILPQQLSSNSDFAQRFEREASVHYSTRTSAPYMTSAPRTVRSSS